MSDFDLTEVKARYERMVLAVDDDPSRAVYSCALSYSIDVPALITEVEELRRRKATLEAQAEIYENEIRAITALGNRLL